jgi:hypothetical protein
MKALHLDPACAPIVKADREFQRIARAPRKPGMSAEEKVLSQRGS